MKKRPALYKLHYPGGLIVPQMAQRPQKPHPKHGRRAALPEDCGGSIGDGLGYGGSVWGIMN